VINTIIRLQKLIGRFLLTPISFIHAKLDEVGFFQSMGFNYRELYWKRKLKNLGIKVRFYPNVTIHSANNVEIGDYSRIGEYVHIWGKGGIRIGKNTMIATHVILSSNSHDPNAEIMIETNSAAPIIVGDNVWLGANSIVLQGVSIGSGTIIGAGSVVTKNIPENVVAVGIPAKILRSRINL
jgi:maltose O-acetyltransferase